MARVKPAERVFLQQYKPHQPLAADDYSRGVRRVALSTALTKRNIQANPRHLTSTLILDVDHDKALLRAFEPDLPLPSWVAQSSSGRAHVGYMLAQPVHNSAYEQATARGLLGRVSHALLLRLDADPLYPGVLTKNPLHPYWDTCWGTSKLHELGSMARKLGDDLPAPVTRKTSRDAAAVAGYGRNCYLFETSRHWAYKAWKQEYYLVTFPEFSRAVEEFVLLENALLPVPLSQWEARAIGKSIARYINKNFVSGQAFVERQRALGQKSGRARQAIALEREAAVMQLRSEGVPWQVVADTLGMSRAAAMRIQTRYRSRAQVTG